MLTSIDVNVSSSSIAFLSASLEDKGIFSSANILQVADVVRRVVFLLVLLFLASSLPICSSWNEWNILPFRTFLANQFNLETSSKFGQRQQVIRDYPRDLSPLEAGKYFEWIIIADIVTLLGTFRQTSLAAIGVERRLHS